MIHGSVAAVVVAFGSDTDRLDRCLGALSAQGAHVVLVDNGSPTPVTHPLAAVVVRRERNDGFAAGVNAGLRVCDRPFVAIVNDDAVFQDGALAACVDALDAAPDSVLAAAPKVMFPDGAHIDSVGLALRSSGEAFSAGVGQPDIGQFDEDRAVLGPCLSAAVFRRDAFDRIGVLDERYFLYYEDVDWALRCFLSGHETLFVPSARVFHEHAATTRSLGERRRFRLVERNLLLCATANLSVRSTIRIWVGRVVVAAKAAIKGPDRTSRAIALASAAARVPAVLPVRRRNRSRAQIADREALRSAEGLTPYVDVDTYTPARPEAALLAAQARLRRGR